MTIFLFSNVCKTPARTFEALPRFIAMLDVLGMKNWLTSGATAAQIANEVESALGRSITDQASAGSVDGISFGPLVGVTHFSDTALIWTPDDTDASLFVLLSVLRHVMSAGIRAKVPFRGAIATGPLVCDSAALRFVGCPLVDAYQWDMSGNPHRGIGISLTPRTVSALSVRGLLARLSRCGALVERDGATHFSHWDASFTAGRDPSPRGLDLIRDCLGRAELQPTTDEGKAKASRALDQTNDLYRACLASARASRSHSNDDCWPTEQDCLRLERLRVTQGIQ
jgi:hypothetical protein